MDKIQRVDSITVILTLFALASIFNAASTIVVFSGQDETTSALLGCGFWSWLSTVINIDKKLIGA